MYYDSGTRIIGDVSLGSRGTAKIHVPVDLLQRSEHAILLKFLIPRLSFGTPVTGMF